MPSVCGKIKVLGVASAGHHLILRGCGLDLSVGATRYRRVPNSEVWVGQPGSIYKDGTWRK